MQLQRLQCAAPRTQLVSSYRHYAAVSSALHSQPSTRLRPAVGLQLGVQASGNRTTKTTRRAQLCTLLLQAAVAGGAAASASNSTTMSGAASDRKIGVLFVCLGNICRSPTAEAMFKAVVESAGLADRFHIDSCGTGGGSSNWYTPSGFSYHEGDEADPRMTAVAKKRGVKLTSRSRPLQPLDLSRFQYIIGMDSKNQAAIVEATEHWRSQQIGGSIPEDYRSRISLMTAYCSKFAGQKSVPDPYYGGADGFECVLDLLEDACEGLLTRIQQEHQL